MMTRLISLALLIAGGLSLPAQGEEKKTPPRKKAETKPKLERCEVGDIRQIHRLGKVYLAGQPSPEDFRIAKKDGLKTVVNLRTKPEFQFDEAKHLKSLDIEYHHVPFRSPDTLTDKVFDAVRKVLKDKKKQPVMVHCASANRVGAVWLAHRVLDGNVKYKDALKEAKTVGLRTAAFEERAQEYIEAARKKELEQKNKDAKKPKSRS